MDSFVLCCLKSSINRLGYLAAKPAAFRSKQENNGGGRSGAFLALDANLELMQRTGQIDVYEYAKTLVNSRQHLIESVDQYTFLYDALCEAVMCNLQPIEMHQLKERSTMYKSKKDRELMELQISHENKLLLMLSSPLRIGDCAGGHRLENRGKNRDVMVVPPDHARPYLQTLHGESKDYTYINAVEVDGFTRKSEFIVTEWPKAQTLDSFWTLVFDHSVHTVINLTNFSNNKLYPPFIHNKGKKNYGPFTVEIMNIQQYPGLTSYMAKITKRVSEFKKALSNTLSY
ncbi:protein-tyrosine phosphatase domain-containing protein [Ditylenchus destructor]|uniref:Protein-tyrosine phosphatase domain-containing protein n=1 Tax=Ditylenchus destructor TaxID=166010 RepID=A0AAD4NC38_9BILA|nr:protein-tyrosine phosphatase domain-containing protein [Ditylenchus destructor]